MACLRLFLPRVSFGLLALTACATSDGGDAVGSNSEQSDSGADDDTLADDDAPADDDTIDFGPAAPTVSVAEPEPAAPAPSVDPNVPNADNPLQACASAVAVGDDPRIDDFEDLNDIPLEVDNRAGGWYSYTDEYATTPQVVEWITTDDPATSGSGVLHVQGSGFQYSGVGLGLRWTETGAEYCYYDASYYEGIGFWARGTGVVRVALQNPSVRPIAEGGSCPEDAVCYDSHGYDVELTPDWSYFRVGFAAVRQAGWGTPVGEFLPTELFTVEFQFPPSSSYDLTLDDVAFFRTGDPLPMPEPEPMPEPTSEPEPTLGSDAGSPEPMDAGAPAESVGDASVTEGDAG